jgi:hypothetical protein
VRDLAEGLLQGDVCPPEADNFAQP